jgi:hypothetical protein
MLVTLQTVISSVISCYALHLMLLYKTRKWNVLSLYNELSAYISTQTRLTLTFHVYIHEGYVPFKLSVCHICNETSFMKDYYRNFFVCAMYVKCKTCSDILYT